jgi:biopolymer transport protein ExbB
METNQALGFAHFIANADGVAYAIFIAMVAMSVFTWVLILAKSVAGLRTRVRSRRFLAMFWNAQSLDQVARHLDEHHPDEPFSHLAYHAFVAARHHQQHGAKKLDEAGGAAEFLTRSIRRVIDEETARLESGLTFLASVGSTAPFVGLFGTVWGIFHALTAIGMSGSASLDKVAGPVGEALIMTGIGLAVALPAVLGYNFLVRSNRVLLAKLDAFAHDMYAFLSTGSRLADPAEVTPIGSLQCGLAGAH